MGKGSSSGETGQVLPQVQSGELADANALTQIATQQAANSQQLYNMAEPGFQIAEDRYQTLASGDPGAILQSIAPAAGQINQATAGAKANIEANSPAGGEKNLALELTDVNRGAQIGQLAAGATTNAPNALAQLAGQGIGESQSAAGLGISGNSAATSSLGSLQSQVFAGQQLQIEQKGQQLGAYEGLLDSATSGGKGGSTIPQTGPGNFGGSLLGATPNAFNADVGDFGGGGVGGGVDSFVGGGGGAAAGGAVFA